MVARDAATGETMHEFAVDHTFNDEQIEWFKWGSALNYMKMVNASSVRSGRVRRASRARKTRGCACT